jgi:hypothetical protein
VFKQGTDLVRDYPSGKISVKERKNLFGWQGIDSVL